SACGGFGRRGRYWPDGSHPRPSRPPARARHEGGPVRLRRLFGRGDEPEDVDDDEVDTGADDVIDAEEVDAGADDVVDADEVDGDADAGSADQEVDPDVRSDAPGLDDEDATAGGDDESADPDDDA